MPGDQKGKPTKILIIEGDPDLLQAETRLLKGADFEVYQARTGEKGLAAARRVDPDLILLSVELTDTNGFLICEMIKSDPDLQDAFVLLISGELVDSRHQAKGLELGAEDYIVRPVSDRELVARIVSLERVKETQKELRDAKQELEAINEKLARSNRDLQDFAHTLSHDLQEPLRMVSSFLSLLARQYGEQLDENAQEYIDFAVDGAERMKSMVQGLLSFSRVTTRGEPMEPVGSQETLSAARDNLHVMISERGAKITAAELPEVRGDFNQITQLFQNLISNAIKYNEQEIPRVEIDVERKGGCWQFSVRDDGVGIDPAHQERIFTIFQREHTRGEYPAAGVGLSICKRIVERHGGKIWVESTPGEGSTFYFTLPSAE
ncbi:MAG: ATP-binding protein [Anaerolineales bacterium]|nr:ATP-binding protein [Anaerolineales bacterium]